MKCCHTLLQLAIIFIQNQFTYISSKCYPSQLITLTFILFVEGRHVIRRSDRYWAGLSTYHIIEQMLMHCIESTGGLTRGRVWQKFRDLSRLNSYLHALKLTSQCKISLAQRTTHVNNTWNDLKLEWKETESTQTKLSHFLQQETPLLTLTNRFAT